MPGRHPWHGRLHFMADIDDQIADAIEKPQSVSVDGQSVTNRPIDDLIKAANFAAQKTAQRRANRGLRTIPVQFPGSMK